MCWEASSACFLLLCHLYLHFYYLCIIVRKCQPAHVSMCPLRVSSGILVPSPWSAVSQRQRWQVWPFVQHQYAWVPAPRRASANQRVTSGFPFTILSCLLATYCRKRGCGQPPWPWVSTSCGAGWVCVFWCQRKCCARIMMSENILAFLGGLDWLFCSFNKPPGQAV